MTIQSDFFSHASQLARLSEQHRKKFAPTSADQLLLQILKDDQSSGGKVGEKE